MSQDGQHRTRRGVLASLAATVAASAGCSSLSGTAGSQNSGASASEQAAVTTTTPVQRDSHTNSDGSGHHHGEDGGHSHDGAEHSTEDSSSGNKSDHTGTDDSGREVDPDAESGLAAFESRLRENFVDIESLTVEDSRVRLTYVTKSTRSHELAAGIETVVVSFIGAYSEDWGVQGLDAKVVEPSKDVMGRWRTESRWVEPVVEGHETQTKLLERTLDTYHGRRTRDHGHGGDDSEDSGANNGTDGDHHGDSDDDHSHARPASGQR